MLCMERGTFSVMQLHSVIFEYRLNKRISLIINSLEPLSHIDVTHVKMHYNSTLKTLAF